MGVDQTVADGRKLLPPIVPGGEPIFVGEKQYDAILRLRERRRRAKEAREREPLKVKKSVQIPRGPKGRFATTKGNQETTNGASTVEFSPVLTDCYLHFTAINGYQQVSTVDSESQSCIPEVGFYCPIVATNDGSEAQSSTPSAIGFYWRCAIIATNEGGGDFGNANEVPFSNASSSFYQAVIVGSECAENIDGVAHGGEAPFSNPAGDFYCPVVATNDDEENIGEVAYSSILNLESPDPTSLLRIMMGNRYSSDEVSEQFQNVARLEDPGFATLLTVMNNAGTGYGKAVDHGHYDVEEVLTKLEGW